MSKPPREEAEEAVRTLLRWAGEDPTREGLLDTPGRVVRAYEDWFSGYNDDPVEFLRRTFQEVVADRDRDPFLVQEFLREANTIGSKCNDAKVAHEVVELKTVIERLREQVQNVE